VAANSVQRPSGEVALPASEAGSAPEVLEAEEAEEEGAWDELGFAFGVEFVTQRVRLR
jgi:hypothetical protein